MKIFNKYKFYIILILIVILSFTVRIFRYNLDSRIEKDGVLYVNMAKDWNSKGFEHAFERNPRIPPLYIFFMMIGEKYGLGAENTGVAISILAGSLTALAIYLIAFIILDKNMALIAAFLAAIHPVFIRLNPEVMRGSLFIFCYTFSLAFFVLGIANKKIYYWGLGGFFAALAVMTRSEGAELILIPFAWLVIEIILDVRNRRNSKSENKILTDATASCRIILKKFIPGLLTAVIVFSISSFPVQYALRNTSSKWTVFDYRFWGYIEGLID